MEETTMLTLGLGITVAATVTMVTGLLQQL